MDDHRRLLLTRLAPVAESDGGGVGVQPFAPLPLGVDQRRTIIGVFRSLLEGLYTHLPQKRATYGLDPAQRLRLLGERAGDPDMTDAVFHREIAEIITDLRDAHTRYLGPRHQAGYAMFLPLLVERYTTPDRTHAYVVSKAEPLTPSERARFDTVGFTAGVTLTHWNGVKIARAVELHAQREVGGRPDTRIARALESLTIRPLRYALPPDEDWVDITFRTKRGAVREIRLDWQRVQLTDITPPPSDRITRALAYDPIADSAREVKKMLFAGPVWLAEQVAAAGVEPQTVAQCHANGWSDNPTGWLAGRFAANVAARVVTHRRRSFGYLRIYSFQLRDDQAFIEEVIELLQHLPPDGLIVDVRANPGGLIWAAEGLLQLFTPNRIHPTRFSMAATDTTRAMARAPHNRHLSAWADSLNTAVTSGVTHSRAIPLTPIERCNNLGQHYHGPVVAIVDATTYSAGDLFAAGFVDNDIGKLICTATATGGGGANVWQPSDIASALHGTGHELDDLGDVSFTIAIRRAERIGNSETDIEDVGVTTPFTHPLTLNDLTNANADLIAYACGLLATSTTTNMTVTTRNDSIHITGTGIDRITIEVDGVPHQSAAIINGTAHLDKIADADQHLIEIVGYHHTTIRQRRRL